MFSTLKPGRVRYGLMLREDGHVMDDGTTARLGEHHLRDDHDNRCRRAGDDHLEFVHQCLRPDLDVAMISTTEQWAQFSVAGPKARELVNSVIDQPIDNESFPFMACGEVTIHGVRVGFSASPSPANTPTRSRSRPAMARRFTVISWPGPRHWAAGPTGWRR
jgi:glycine cleavage system aminomethyltransferase T